MARLEGREVDRIPNLCILMRFAAQYSGATYRDFCLDSKTQVSANLRCHRKLGIDAVTVMSDPYGEAHDYGMEIEYPSEGTPCVARAQIEAGADIIGIGDAACSMPGRYYTVNSV